MKKQKTIAERLRAFFHFGGNDQQTDEVLLTPDVLVSLMRQWHEMAKSDDPEMREIGERHLRQVAEDAARIRAKEIGNSRPRRSKMPKLDAWMMAQDLSQSNDVLWDAVPLSDTGDLYRDGDKIVEVSRSGHEHSIGRSGFNSRLATARKSR